MTVLQLADNLTGTTTPATAGSYLPTVLHNNCRALRNGSADWWIWRNDAHTAWILSPILGTIPTPPDPWWSRQHVDPVGAYTPQEDATGTPDLADANPLRTLRTSDRGVSAQLARGGLGFLRGPKTHTPDPEHIRRFAMICRQLGDIWLHELDAGDRASWNYHAAGDNYARSADQDGTADGWRTFLHEGFGPLWHGSDLDLVTSAYPAYPADTAAATLANATTQEITTEITFAGSNVPSEFSTLFTYQIRPGAQGTPRSIYQTRLVSAYIPFAHIPGPFTVIGPMAWPMLDSETVHLYHRYCRGYSAVQHWHDQIEVTTP